MDRHLSTFNPAEGEARTRSPSLFASYYSLFEPLPAVTPELEQEAHRIRFQVYCVEHNFEDPTDNPNGLERDEYDCHSVHGILRHRPSGATVGAVRLVLSDPKTGGESLPIQKICDRLPLRELAVLPPHATAEISRFSVSKTFRRRATDADHTHGRNWASDRDNRLSIPHIALGLVTVALQLGMDHSIEYVCAVMEPSLLRLLAGLGIYFRPLGPLVDYHGRRQPCYSNVDELFGRLRHERLDIWDVVTDCGRLWQPKPYALQLAS